MTSKTRRRPTTSEKPINLENVALVQTLTSRLSVKSESDFVIGEVEERKKAREGFWVERELGVRGEDGGL